MNLNFGSNCFGMKLLRDDCNIHGEEIDKLHQETGELMAIFITMVAKLRKSGV